MREIINQLNKIDTEARINALEKEIKREQNPRILDKKVKEYKILKSIQKEGLNPVDAFTKSIMQVTPAQFRAPLEMPNGTIQLPDNNILLRDIALANNVLSRAEGRLPDETVEKLSKNLYEAVEQMSGFDHPYKNKTVKNNSFTEISGTQPKKGFFQHKLVRMRQDLSGRGVISPDPSLDIDQIAIPYDIAFKAYEPYIVKEFISMGYSTKEAKKEIENKTDRTKTILRNIGKDRPIASNRAPSVWKTSITGHKPIFTEDKNVKVPNLYVTLSDADFDGDSSLCYIELRHSWSGINNFDFDKVVNRLISFWNKCIHIKKG